MTNHTSFKQTEFDDYAVSYDAALAHGLSISGEDKNYFANARIAWTAGCLRELRDQPEHVIDLGCGTGSASPFLLKVLGAKSVLGIDTSAKSLEVAKQTYGSEPTQFRLVEDYVPCQQIDLVYCNGVFHHIPPRERPAAVDYVYRSLRPLGLFAFWENNPWNPGTRYVMNRIPFDRDAIVITSGETRRLLRAGGFELLRVDFLFIFPKVLRWLRYVEPFVTRLPFGAQYQVLARKL